MSKDEKDIDLSLLATKEVTLQDNGSKVYHINTNQKTRFKMNVGSLEPIFDEKTNTTKIRVKGIASSTSVDHYGTEMSFKALMKMKEQVKKGIVILPRHDSITGSGLAEWDEVIGRTINAEVTQSKVINPSKLNIPQFVLEVESDLYADDERTLDLIRRLKRGEPIGQSIGGWFEKIQVEEDESGEVQRVIVQDVTLDHIAITRAPANPDSGGLSINIRSSIQTFLDRSKDMPKRTTNKKQSTVKSKEVDNTALETRDAEIDSTSVEVEPVSEEQIVTGDAVADQNQVPFVPLEEEVTRMKEEMARMKEELSRKKEEERIKLLMQEKEELTKELERIKAELEEISVRDLEDEDREEKEDHEDGALADDQDHIEALIEDQEEDAEDLAEDETRVMYEKMKEKLSKEVQQLKEQISLAGEISRAVVPFQSNLPLAPENLSWDWNTESQNEILGPNGDNWELYKRAHLYFDENANIETKSAYKLPIAKIVDGELKVVLRGLISAVGAINGARGGVDIPDDQRVKIYDNIKKYYAKFDREVPELVNRSKEQQDSEKTLDNTQNLSNSSINTHLHRSEDMNSDDMKNIIAEVTKSVLEAMKSEQQEQRSVATQQPEVETRSAGREIVEIAHGSKEPTLEELKARLEQAENTLSRVLAQPLRKGRHTTTNVRGIGAEVELDHLIENTSKEGSHSLATIMKRNKNILLRQSDQLDTNKVTNHELQDILKQGLRAAYLDGLIGTPVDGWQ